MGPISREGSSTTAAPVQVSMVGTPMAVVLKPPGPAKTRAWVEPVRQGSISSGAAPPWPQLALVGRVEGAAGDAVLVDAVGLADDDAAKRRPRSGEQTARVAHGEPVGVAKIVGAAADEARAGRRHGGAETSGPNRAARRDSRPRRPVEHRDRGRAEYQRATRDQYMAPGDHTRATRSECGDGDANDAGDRHDAGGQSCR